MAGLTLDALFRRTLAEFEAADLPAEDARHLVSGVLGLTLTEMVTEAGREIDPEECAAVEAAVERRKRREPVYRILGAREFYGLDFLLSPETLEPRPDTETLVAAVLPHLNRLVEERGTVRFADLGTGTGAIAIALLKHCAGANALATDISAEALETARSNALINGVADRFECARGFWYDAVIGRYDVIVSNPPYIGSADIEGLEPEVREHDPRAALDGGADGLDAYRVIAAGAADHLSEEGLVAVEVGFDQKVVVSAIFAAAGFNLLDAVRDFGGNDRVLIFAGRDAA
ncbi:peptide chain release factor N(5)-glutamine methyltransferase [Martelella endophytica]|uniref:Release factor glutamine methyltransferase n=1 Tax=Martelella endophytica TaxID=1486262 RepID=A0A0D5LKQ0_MAREN|nr:peptide chain release factor N(5)-glutamine methyltransferase [Martelella endophytica]AJY44784.1 SAM-dependent methyltransferase [Martelella endophytica]